MAYSKQLNSNQPGLFVFLLDQSVSMQSGWGVDSSRSKSELVADILNKFLRDLTLRCAKGAEIKKRIHIGILGYGSGVNSAFLGALAGRDTVDIAEVASNPARVEDRKKKESDGAGGIVETATKFPVWVDAVANGSTPMREAFAEAKNIIQNWLQVHPTGYPPIVINVTDGEYTSGSPSGEADAIKSLSTDDGNILVFNIHISGSTAAPIFFPSSSSSLSEQFARELCDMSSELPGPMLARAGELYPGTATGAKGFAFNGDIVALVNFLDIGSTVDDDRSVGSPASV